MVTKKQVKEVKNIFFDGVYHFAVGRRKAAVAQVRVYCDKKGVDNQGLIVNGKVFDEYFMTNAQKEAFMGALRTTGLQDTCAVSVLVKGGGLSGQAEAVRLGISRALVKFDETLRPALKSEGFLTRDARVVERKKPGLRKARRSPQWSKR